MTLAAHLQSQKARNIHVGIFPLEFDGRKKNASESVSIPDTIHLIPIGQWDHDLYGPILITASDCREFVQNFNAGIRKGVFITAGHEGYEELPATGWITSLEVRDDGLWGMVEWNELGKQILADKQYKFFSPEFYRDYEDPQSHALYRNVLTGGALTKSPYFKELSAIVFSEKNIRKIKNSENTMNLNEVLAIPLDQLTDEQKAFIIEHKAELTPEQLVSHTSIVDAPPADAETDEEKTAREEKEKGDANEAAGLNRDGSAKTTDAPAPANDQPVAGSDKKILMSETEVAILRRQADEGAKAFAEIKRNKITASVNALTFSTNNKAGKFLPKSTDNLRAFMESLNDEQSLKFSALIAELPTQLQFQEVGTDAPTDGTPVAEVEAKVAQKIEASVKAGKPMTYSEALKEVMAGEKGLEQRYDESLPSARKSQ